MLLGAAAAVNILNAANQKHGDEFFFDNEDEFATPVLLSFDWNAIIEASGFVSPWWPAHGMLIGGRGFDGDNLLEINAKHSDMWRSFGSNGRLGFVGVTRDQYGSAIGNCRVRCFRAATDELMSSVLSDANGNYIATTPYYEGHYLTVHKSGTPDICGATPETLFPA